MFLTFDQFLPLCGTTEARLRTSQRMGLIHVEETLGGQELWDEWDLVAALALDEMPTAGHQWAGQLKGLDVRINDRYAEHGEMQALLPSGWLCVQSEPPAVGVWLPPHFDTARKRLEPFDGETAF